MKGKTALVTGGSRGIGAAIVRRLASEGADIALIYAGSTEASEDLCAEVTAQYGVKAVAYAARSHAEFLLGALLNL